MSVQNIEFENSGIIRDKKAYLVKDVVTNTIVGEIIVEKEGYNEYFFFQQGSRLLSYQVLLDISVFVFYLNQRKSVDMFLDK